MALVDSVLKTITNEKMIPTPGTVLCAVSGGADSTALLSVLLSRAAELGITVQAAHVNHCLRGEESDRDENFVRELCSRLGVTLYVNRTDIAARAKSCGLGIEECARNVRYDFFNEIINKYDISYLATAHNAKDNLETAIFNLARGTGIAGIAGIPPARAESGYTVIRPLIRETRENIEEYLLKSGLQYIIDSTNLSDEYTRNHIRLNILPLLEKINPSLYATAANTQRILRQDADFIDETVRGEYKRLVSDSSCDADALSSIHPAIAGRLVGMMYRELMPDGVQLTGSHIAAVLSAASSANPSAEVILPCSITVRREYRRIHFIKNDSLQKLIPRTLEIGETTVLGEQGFEIYCGFEPKIPQSFKLINKFFFDYSHIYGILSVRARNSGDYIHLAGHKNGKSLKKLMIDLKIPRYKRDIIPVICDEKGIIAVCDIGVCKRAAVTADTREILSIQISYKHREGYQ